MAAQAERLTIPGYPDYSQITKEIQKIARLCAAGGTGSSS